MIAFARATSVAGTSHSLSVSRSLSPGAGSRAPTSAIASGPYPRSVPQQSYVPASQRATSQRS